VAHVIIAEIGVDMRRFTTVGHLRSWAGLCPQLNESAGKVMSRRLRKGAPWLILADWNYPRDSTLLPPERC
jgi:transposase